MVDLPELEAPLELALLTEECSWETRRQMSRTSATDFVEALLLDVHHAQYLQAHPHVPVKDSILQDPLLGDAETGVLEAIAPQDVVTGLLKLPGVEIGGKADYGGAPQKAGDMPVKPERGT